MILRGRLYRIVTSYAVAGVTVWGGAVDSAPPIFRWMIGKRFEAVLAWAQSRGVEVENLGVVSAIFALLLSGCALNYSRDQIGFFDQCVKIQAWGISAATAWGPVNLGWLFYERNVDCKRDQPVSSPAIPMVDGK